MATSDSKTDAVTWTTVSEIPEELTRVTFPIIGDTFIGRYTGHKTLMNESGSYVQLLFTGGDGVSYYINPGYTLKTAFRKIAPGMVTRIRLTDQRDIGKASPMGIYQVDTTVVPKDAPVPGPAVSSEGMTAVNEASREEYPSDWPDEPTF
jgi:hypothetical protein